MLAISPNYNLIVPCVCIRTKIYYLLRPSSNMISFAPQCSGMNETMIGEESSWVFIQ